MLPAHYNKKESSYFCRFTFGQFFTLLVLEIFTLFFIFYLGARYGGELLGVKPPAPVALQPSGIPKVSTTDANVVATTQDPEIKALAKDLLQSAPTPDLKQRVSQMLQENQAKKGPLPQPYVAQKKSEEPLELRAAPKPKAEPVITLPSPKQKPVVETAPPDANFSVQVGSYPNADEAYSVVDGWKAKGYPAYLVSADIPNRGRWYRVRLGGFQTKEAAMVFLQKLKNKESVEAIIVTNE